MEKDSSRQIKRKSVFIIPLMLAVAAAVFLAVYVSKMSDTATEFTRSYMKELAEHDKANIIDKVQGYKEDLLDIVEMIRLQRIDHLSDAVDMLRIKQKSGGLKDLFLIAGDGTTYSYNNVITDHSEEAYVRSVLDEGKEYLAKPDMASQWYDWNNSLRYALPIDTIRLDGVDMVGICGEYSFEQIGTSLQLKSFNGEGISTLVDQKGNVLSQTGVVTQKPIESNFFEDVKQKFRISGKDEPEKLVRDMTGMKAVEFEYWSGEKEYLCISIPIPDQELTLISSVPVQTAKIQYNRMLRLTIALVLAIAAVICILGIILYRTYKDSVYQRIQRDAAEELAVSKSMFLSNMSHEIRTPLNAIIGFSELLSKSQGMSEEDRDKITKIDISSRFLLSLINDILDMSRIESGKMELNPVPFKLDTLVGDVDSIIGGQARQLGIQYVSENECQGLGILGDSMRIQQILMNLLSNALKFTQKGGTVSLRTVCAREDKDSCVIRFTVTDTGCGMSQEFLQKLYVPFTQEYNKNTKKQTGTGLGLSICYKMVQLMKGTIRADSKVGAGSTFTAELPFKKAEVPLSNEMFATGGDKTDWSGVTILAAEDNELNMEILVSILHMHDIKTMQAVNGKEAVDIFQNSEPGEISLILMDVQMPVMDGIEATEQIRASDHPCAKSVPILAVTANAFTSDVEEVQAHGMNDHIAKPIDTDQLFAKLYQYIYGKGERTCREGE